MIHTIDKVNLDTQGSLSVSTGFDLGWAPGSATYLTGKGLEGWFGSSPVRRSKAELMGAHGSHAERGFKDERLITINGHHVAASRAAAGAMADSLAAYLGDGTRGRFRVLDADLGTRWADVYLAGGGADVIWTGGLDVGFQIFLVAPDPRKYGDLVTSAPTGIPVPGGGLTFPLFSRSVLSSSVTRTNLFTNPSAESATTGWGYYAGTGGAAGMTVGTGGGYPGAGYARMTWTAGTSAANGGMFFQTPTVTPGTVYSFSAFVRPSKAQNLALSLEWYDAGNARIGATVAGASAPCAANQWTRLSFAGQTAPAGAVKATATLYVASGGVAWVAGDTLDADGALAEASSTVGPYFDGDSARVQVDADTARLYSWSGTPGASVSLETTTDYVGPAGVLDLGSGGYPGRASAYNPGTADTGPVFTIWGDNVPGFTITDLTSARRLVYNGTLTTGQTLVLDSNDGSVTLDGYSPQDSKLVVSDWTRLGRGESGTWQFESPGSTNAKMTVGVTPAWW